MKNNSVGLLNLLALKTNRLAIVAVAELLNQWNWFPYGYINSAAGVLFCKLFNGKFCDLVMSLFADEDPTIENTQRYDVYMSNSPSGASYRNFIHYA